jgi:hypothetical protein
VLVGEFRESGLSVQFSIYLSIRASLITLITLITLSPDHPDYPLGCLPSMQKFAASLAIR